jgi:hypothetical protein
MASEFDPSRSPFLQGIFAPTQSELRETPLEVLSGAVPHDLVGTYYRTGPNARFAPIGSYTYPLDGDGMVVDTVKAIFAAATKDDLTQFHAVTASGFYIFDNGVRFDGDAIMQLIKAQHDSGKVYEWNVTDPDVHVIGNVSWIAYINRGSITDASGRQPMEWLESAFLQKQNGVWKIVFMHSDRAKQPSEKPK